MTPKESLVSTIQQSFCGGRHGNLASVQARKSAGSLFQRSPAEEKSQQQSAFSSHDASRVMKHKQDEQNQQQLSYNEAWKNKVYGVEQ